MDSNTAPGSVGYTQNTAVLEQHTTTLNPLQSYYPWLVEDARQDPPLPSPPPRLDTIISDDATHVLEIILLTFLCGVFSASGLVANVINVLVFLRQGALSSSSNVTLLALAFADIGCLVPLLCNSLNYTLHYSGVPSMFLTPAHFMDTAVVWPHIMFMQIVSLITAYIAFERCLCVLLPLKVKSLFSAKKSAIVTGSIASLVTASFIPTFATHAIGKVSDPSTNQTKIVFEYTEFHFQVIEVSDLVHAAIIRPSCLIIVLVCTQITIYRVKLSSSWRNSIAKMASTPTPDKSNTAGTGTRTNQSDGETSKSQGSQNQSARDVTQSSTIDNSQAKTMTLSASTVVSKEARLIKMITLISTVFMACTAPDIVTVQVVMHLPGDMQITQGDNLFRLLIAGQLCLESINSSVNIFLYYRMSTSYRTAFRGLMGRQG